MLPYITFPAFRLQSDLRETFGGEAFWQALRKKMNKKVRESKLIKEREEIIKAEDDEKQEEYKRKLEFYEARIIEINEKYYKEQMVMRNKTAEVRKHRRRGSDGLIGVTFPIEDYREELNQMIEERATALEEAFQWDELEEEDMYQGLPIARDRLNYSFIWDRYQLFSVDEAALADGGITIDPTNKNLNLKAEISKLINKQHVSKSASQKKKKTQGQGGAESDSGITSDDSPRNRLKKGQSNILKGLSLTRSQMRGATTVMDGAQDPEAPSAISGKDNLLRVLPTQLDKS